MSYATSEDVAELAAKELDTAELAAVERRLEQAERMIRRRIPDFDTKVEDEDYLQIVVDVECEMVLRWLMNPEGYRVEADGQYSYTRSADAADNSIRLLPSELELLGVRPSRVFSIAPAIGGRAL